MLEYVHFTNRVFADKLYNDPSANMQIGLETEEQLEIEEYQEKNDQMLCSMGYFLHESLMLGNTVLEATGASELEMETLKKEGMKSLVMHEVGHTLGLNHNMKASQLFSPEQLADADFIKGKALTGSVMDYAGLISQMTGQNKVSIMIWLLDPTIYGPFSLGTHRSQTTRKELLF